MQVCDRPPARRHHVLGIQKRSLRKTSRQHRRGPALRPAGGKGSKVVLSYLAYLLQFYVDTFSIVTEDENSCGRRVFDGQLLDIPIHRSLILLRSPSVNLGADLVPPRRVRTFIRANAQAKAII